MHVGDNILIYDIETTSIDLLHRQYDLGVKFKRFRPEEIVRDWTILSAAWKFLGQDKVHCVSVSPQNPLNDAAVVHHLHAALQSANILVGHNSDAFDFKKFNARAIIYGLPPISPKQTVDTLKLSRKHFKWTSNKLSYIANKLGLPAKDESPDWDKILEGDADELRTMREYNKQDVIVTEQLYLKLRPYHTTHPVITHMEPPIRDVEGFKVISCPKCNSTNYMKQGFKFQKNGKKQQCQCNDCKGWFQIDKLIRF